MSSYSEYLSRAKQRLPQILDTRPHRDAGHQTEIIKRRAASLVLERTSTAPSQNLVLDGPTTRGVLSPYKPTHAVHDTSRYTEYTAGQAVAQSERTSKLPQIQQVCYSSAVMPELNDTLRLNPAAAARQALKNAGLKVNCCTVCGEPSQYTTACPCALTVAQQVGLPTSRFRPSVPS